MTTENLGFPRGGSCHEVTDEGIITHPFRFPAVIQSEAARRAWNPPHGANNQPYKHDLGIPRMERPVILIFYITSAVKRVKIVKNVEIV
mgnify:CR=1